MKILKSHVKQYSVRFFTFFCLENIDLICKYVVVYQKSIYFYASTNFIKQILYKGVENIIFLLVVLRLLFYNL